MCFRYKYFETGIFKRVDNQIFNGIFFNDFPMSGMYIDSMNRRFKVEFVEYTMFSAIKDKGNLVFKTKEELKVRYILAYKFVPDIEYIDDV